MKHEDDGNTNCKLVRWKQFPETSKKGLEELEIGG